MRAILIGGPAHLTEMEVSNSQTSVLRVPEMGGLSVTSMNRPLPDRVSVRALEYYEISPLAKGNGQIYRRVFVWAEL
jgi:hypothetical protein